MNTLQGIAASPGIASGPAFHYRRGELRFQRRAAQDPAQEWERLQTALEAARRQLADVVARAEAESAPEQAGIFRAQALMLQDPELLQAARTAIEDQALSAEAALSDAAETYAQALAALDDEYLKARAADVRDVTSRVLRILAGSTESPGQSLRTPAIVLADDLAPSDTVTLNKSLVLGFCTAGGGPTSHTAILARAMGLPAVVGLGPGLLDIPAGATLLVDGGEGTVLVEPDGETLAAYRVQQRAADRILAQARTQAHEPAITRDGRRVEVVANIGRVEEAQSALAEGAEGVGLLRSEFLYLARSRIPGEEEQYRAYRAILDVMGRRPVILRTLDIGGDKELPYLDRPQETNPFLGVRGIRLTLAHPELLKPQLRAALRAGARRNLKLMFPMIATAAEVRAARALLDECRAELVDAGRQVAETMEVGIMIEVPGAALMADQLAGVADFFSIGTNDLSQYTLAAERTNPRVATLATGFQPAVLRLVRDVVIAAHAAGRWVGVCGELAGEPLAAPILVGLGVDELSMSSPAIPGIKHVIRALTVDEARDLARSALELETAGAVRSLVRKGVPAAAALAG